MPASHPAYMYLVLVEATLNSPVSLDEYQTKHKPGLYVSLTAYPVAAHCARFPQKNICVTAPTYARDCSDLDVGDRYISRATSGERPGFVAFETYRRGTTCRPRNRPAILTLALGGYLDRFINIMVPTVSIRALSAY
jgi:hypothetical protein